MNVEVLQKDDLNIRLLIREVDIPFMNALRRIVLSEVPCMAIDDVVIVENYSILQDEIIAHRFGLIPLKTNLDTYNLPEECPCKSEFGCNMCRVTLALEAESKEGTRTVYSGELKSENPEIVPVSDKIPLLKLAKQQRLRLEAYARLGRGKTHARWQPVSMCSYKYYPKIEIVNRRCDGCGKCVEVCPRRVLEKTESKVQVRDVLACTLCQDCVEICPQKPSAIQVLGDETSFIMNVESTGALPPERTVIEAAKVLEKQLEQLKNQIQVQENEEEQSDKP